MSRISLFRQCRLILAALAAACMMTAYPDLARSLEVPLVPQTKLRITVLQWMPLKGAYENWTAVGGEFTVSSDETIFLPVIGAVPVANLTGPSLSERIARELQKKLGLVERPNATVEVIDYPPVFIVGDVQAPGAYPFRYGLSVLQAIALGGGEIKVSPDQARAEIQLVGELRGLENERLRTSARIARLQAERARAADVKFSAMPLDPAGKALVEEALSQEAAIMTARAREQDRQKKSLTELRQLLETEIEVLEQKISAAENDISVGTRELEAVTMLVEKGIAVASRRSELERALAGYRGERLDQLTAVMRARQSIAETTRNLDGLDDRRQTEIALELQQAQSSLEQLLLKREVSQNLLLDLLSSTVRGAGAVASYSIIRRAKGQSVETVATESTALQPGDVVKVDFLPPSQSQALVEPRQSSAEAVQ